METKSSSSESYDSYERNRHQTIDEVVEYMKRMKGLEVLDVLGRGTYGDVLLVHDQTTDSKKAIKVIREEHTSEMETTIWPSLLHQNILPTEEPIEMEDETIIFISPVMFKGLDSLLSDDAILTYTDCIQVLKTWLKEALLGVQYMHEQGYCHMDLKLDNILVGYDGHACIADFTFLNKSNRLLTIHDLGLPRQYQPPEVFQEEFRNAVNGIAVDMWSFGIAVVEAFTNQHLIKSVEFFNNWHKVMQPELKRILENPTFETLAKVAFPKCSFMEGELLDILTISNLLLQEDSHIRPMASKVLVHPFFEAVKDYKVVMSDIYTGEDFGSSKQIFTDGEKSGAFSSQKNMNLAETGDKVQEHDTKVEVVNMVVEEEHIENSACKEKTLREGLYTIRLFGDIQCVSEPLLHSSFRDVNEEVAVIKYVNRVISNSVPRMKSQEEEYKSHQDLKFAENSLPLFVSRLCEDVCDPVYTSSKANSDEFDGTFAGEEKTHIEKLAIDNNNLRVLNFDEKPLKFMMSKYDESITSRTSLKSSNVSKLCEVVCDPDADKSSKTNGDEFDGTFVCKEQTHIENLVIDNDYLRVDKFDEMSLKSMMSTCDEFIMSNSAPKLTKRKKSLKSWFRKKFTKCTRLLFCCCCNQA